MSESATSRDKEDQQYFKHNANKLKRIVLIFGKQHRSSNKRTQYNECPILLVKLWNHFTPRKTVSCVRCKNNIYQKHSAQNTRKHTRKYNMVFKELVLYVCWDTFIAYCIIYNISLSFNFTTNIHLIMLISALHHSQLSAQTTLCFVKLDLCYIFK